MPHKRLFKLSVLSLGASALFYPALAGAQKPANNPNYISKYMSDTDKDESDEQPFINPYDEKYRPLADADKQNNQKIFSNSSFSINLARGAGNNPVLRISQPVSASGCFNISMPKPETSFQGPMLWVNVGAPTITIDKTVRYAHIDCPQAPQAVQSDVVLNRDRLIENKVRRMTLKNDFGIDNYTVNLTDSKLELIPQSSTLFKPNRQIKNKNPLVFWFYPENTVVLNVPQAKANDMISDDLNKLASAKGLINLSSVVKDFPQNDTPDKSFYFVDPSGITTKSLSEGGSIHFGEVKTFETFYGPDGAYEQPKALAVFAKLPGQTD